MFDENSKYPDIEFPDLSKLNEDQIFEFSSNLTTIIANKLSEAIKRFYQWKVRTQ